MKSTTNSPADLPRSLGGASVAQMQKSMAEAETLAGMSKHLRDFDSMSKHLREFDSIGAMSKGMRDYNSIAAITKSMGEYDSVAAMLKSKKEYDSIAGTIGATDRNALKGVFDSVAASQWEATRAAMSGNQLAAQVPRSGPPAGSRAVYDAAAQANREALNELTILTPPAMRFGPSLVEVMRTSDERHDKRHREQLAEVKRIAANNDRRTEEIDKREQAFQRLTMRVNIILGVGAVVVGAWIYLLPYIFG